jgi:NAD(P)-dependent dehydrogenase (short-subunit alcohol dehydrogenase family)
LRITKRLGEKQALKTSRIHSSWTQWQCDYSRDLLLQYLRDWLGSRWFTIVAFLGLLDAGNKKGNLEQKSQVIATSSIGSLNRNVPGGFAYGQSKAATTHMMKQLATNLAPLGIRSNILAPGCKFSFQINCSMGLRKFQDTSRKFALRHDSYVILNRFWPLFWTCLTILNLTWIVFPSELAAGIIGDGVFSRAQIPLERVGTEEDMAGCILFLTSRAGAYLTGNVMLIDGGRLSMVPATYWKICSDEDFSSSKTRKRHQKDN